MNTEPTEFDNIPIEYHPWQPFIPDGAKILIMGTFPPGNHRWSMDFYYPNPTNDLVYDRAHIHGRQKRAET